MNHCAMPLQSIHHHLLSHIQRIAEMPSDHASAWQAQRINAARRFLICGPPQKRDENYRHADIATLLAAQYQMHGTSHAAIPPQQALFQCDLPRLDAHHLFLINGVPAPDHSNTTPPEGALFLHPHQQTPIHDYLKPHPSLPEDPMALMAQALAESGFLLRVQQHAHLQKPIQILHLLQGDGPRLTASRNQIILEPHARAQVLICLHTLAPTPFLDHAILHCLVQPHAQLDITILQNAHNRTAQILHIDAQIREHAQISVKTLSIHGGFTRNNLRVHLQQPHAQCQLLGAALLDGNQYADTHTTLLHLAPNCKSSQLYKNLLDDNAQSAFYGLINVHPDAQLTEAFQRAASISRSPNAIARAKPQLIIHADDVKCSHGATVGQLDDNARFYLRSRGIPLPQVDRMLMNAFVGDVLKSISHAPLRERLESIVEKRLRGEHDRCHYGCQAWI